MELLTAFFWYNCVRICTYSSYILRNYFILSRAGTLYCQQYSFDYSYKIPPICFLLSISEPPNQRIAWRSQTPHLFHYTWTHFSTESYAFFLGLNNLYPQGNVRTCLLVICLSWKSCLLIACCVGCPHCPSGFKLSRFSFLGCVSPQSWLLACLTLPIRHSCCTLVKHPSLIINKKLKIKKVLIRVAYPKATQN